MRSIRIIYIFIEALTLAATIFFVVLLFQYFQAYIKSDLIKSQTSDIDKVDITIDDYVKNSLILFENYLRLAEKGDALFLLQDFSDVYDVNHDFSVARVVKREATSHIFVGYDLSTSKMAGFLRSVPHGKTHYSPAFRSTENEKLSFYVAKADREGYMVGRIGLDRVKNNLARLADYTASVILIATKDGYVLSSTRNDITLNVLPAMRQTEIRFQDHDYLLTRKTSRILENDIIILTPLSTVYQILGSIRHYSLIFIALMIGIALLKMLGHTRIILKPLRNFSILLKKWEVDGNPPVIAKHFLTYEEIATLYLSFKQKIEKIQELFIQLRQNEQDINKMRAYLKNIIDSMPSMLISVDREGIIHEWNDAASRFTGLAATEALGRKIWDVMPILQKYKQDCFDALTNRQQKNIGREMLTDGSDRYMNIALFPLIQNGVTEVAIRMDDVTEHEKTEQQLKQAQKMETIGTLVGGIAHDFNNILSGIVGTISMMKQHLQQSQEIPRQKLDHYIHTMDRSSARASDMIKQMLILARKQELSLVPVELNGIIKQVISICTSTFDKRIEIITRPWRGDAMVLADPVQMEQVILNLAVNAMHAMTLMRQDRETRYAKLTISVTKVFADKVFCRGHLEAQPALYYWIVSVQDTGVGMDVKTVAKIFDPFFSTKEKGKGSGLGLTIVYNIVREHKGFVDVYSEPGKGSTFNVFLPVSDQTGIAEPAVEALPLPEGEGLILIIDDEETVRTVAAEMLEICGYQVMTAENGIQGIDLYGHHHDKIKVVLLDINMPIISGAETMIKLKEINPQVKVVVNSGFIKDEKADVLLNLGALGFVQKPFTLFLLAKAIEEAIRSPEDGIHV